MFLLRNRSAQTFQPHSSSWKVGWMRDCELLHSYGLTWLVIVRQAAQNHHLCQRKSEFSTTRAFSCDSSVCVRNSIERLTWRFRFFRNRFIVFIIRFSSPIIYFLFIARIGRKVIDLNKRQSKVWKFLMKKNLFDKKIKPKPQMCMFSKR